LASLVGMKKLMRLAERQHSVFSRTQALACGVTPAELKGLLQRGTVERIVWGCTEWWDRSEPGDRSS